jgi:acetyl-CoA acyltransferase
MKQAYVLLACRTAGCKAKKGKLRNVRPDDLAAAVIEALVERAGVEPTLIDDVILGCAFPEGEQGLNVGRVAAMKAGLGYQVPGMTLNRMCASGLQAIAVAAERIAAGAADAVIAGGVESMSMVPMGGNKYSANPGLMGAWPEAYASMGITAERVAEKHAVTRDMQDEFAVLSHAKAARAIEEGRFAEEIVPVEVESVRLVDGKMARTSEIVTVDDGVRADTTVDTLAGLKPAFKKGGTVTAGNASQITDGAAAALVVSEGFLGRVSLAPAARFAAYAVAGVPPEIMGMGPVEAIPAALARAGLRLDDVGRIELNEAFAAQALAVIREANLAPDLVNVNGGAIALGHPLGCTGAKLTATLLAEMDRSGSRYGLVTMCIGGGMGAAGVLEKA